MHVSVGGSMIVQKPTELIPLDRDDVVTFEFD